MDGRRTTAEPPLPPGCRAGRVSFGAMEQESPIRPVLMRELLGASLREQRAAQGRTLREISATARVSLGYLSEVERGQKEASSELLAAICGALDVPMSHVLSTVSEKMALHENVTPLPVGGPVAYAA